MPIISSPSSNGLVPSDNKLLSEPLLTYVIVIRGNALNFEDLPCYDAAKLFMCLHGKTIKNIILIFCLVCTLPLYRLHLLNDTIFVFRSVLLMCMHQLVTLYIQLMLLYLKWKLDPHSLHLDRSTNPALEFQVFVVTTHCSLSDLSFIGENSHGELIN